MPQGSYATDLYEAAKSESPGVLRARLFQKSGGGGGGGAEAPPSPPPYLHP